jgi:parallel beta-helix repeat protein
VFPGTYRETINIPRGGSDAAHPISIKAMHGGEVNIKGSDLVTGWVRHAGNIWKREGWQVNSQQVFLDGKPLEQIGEASPLHRKQYAGKPLLPSRGHNLNDLRPGTFWYDQNNKALFICLPVGNDPKSHFVEASVRKWIIPPGSSHHNYDFIELSGLNFYHSNQTADGHTMGLVNVWGRFWKITGCSFCFGDFAGLHVVGEGHYISNNVINNNGDVGISISGSDQAHNWRRYDNRPSQNIVFKKNETSFNNYRGFNRSWGAGGLKAIPSCTGIKLLEHKSSSNKGHGIWFDGWCRDITISRCISQGNDRAGIFYEISDEGVITNNLVINNYRHGIYISASSDVTVANNTLDKNWAGIVLHGMPRKEHPTMVNNTVRNNIISDNVLVDLVIYKEDNKTHNNTSDFNLYNEIAKPIRLSFTDTPGYTITHQDLKAFAKSSGQERHSITQNPLWVDPAKGDYRLKADSPAIDRGTLQVRGLGDLDFSGNPRVGSQKKTRPVIDIGAFEFH